MIEARKAKLCADFLAACLLFGWKKSDLDWLQKLWWKYDAWKYHKGKQSTLQQ